MKDKDDFVMFVENLIEVMEDHQIILCHLCTLIDLNHEMIFQYVQDHQYPHHSKNEDQYSKELIKINEKKSLVEEWHKQM